MADFISLKTPDRYAAKGLRFGDYTLDAASIQDNCKRISDGLVSDSIRANPNQVLEATKSVIHDLGQVVRGHREYIRGLKGAQP